MTATFPRETLVEVTDELLVFARGRLAKATLPAAFAARAGFVEPFSADLAAYFAAMAERVTGGVGKALEIGWDPDDDIDWTIEEAELRAVLVRWYTTIGEAAFAGVAEQLAVELRFDLSARPLAAVLARIATQVRGITETSREALRALVATAVERGYSIEQLLAGVDADAFAGLRDLVAGWGTGSRAETIALTETALAYNLSAAAGYEASGLVDEVEIFDGPECGWESHDDDDLAHGSIRTLAEWQETPIAHPQCQRAAGPVVIR